MYFNILIESFKYCQRKKKFCLFAYVLMKNHFHAILSADNLAKFMKEYKSYTARQIVNQLKEDNRNNVLNLMRINKKKYKTDSIYQVWQEGFHPQLIQGIDMFRQKANYIHENPVRGGYVENPEDWKYSSATNFILGKGLLEIEDIV